MKGFKMLNNYTKNIPSLLRLEITKKRKVTVRMNELWIWNTFKKKRAKFNACVSVTALSKFRWRHASLWKGQVHHCRQNRTTVRHTVFTWRNFSPHRTPLYQQLAHSKGMYCSQGEAFCTAKWNTQIFYVYVFCVDLRTDSHYFPIQH